MAAQLIDDDHEDDFVLPFAVETPPLTKEQEQEIMDRIQNSPMGRALAEAHRSRKSK